MNVQSIHSQEEIYKMARLEKLYTVTDICSGMLRKVDENIQTYLYLFISMATVGICNYIVQFCCVNKERKRKKYMREKIQRVEIPNIDFQKDIMMIMIKGQI
jgi:hypothetical protein